MDGSNQLTYLGYKDGMYACKARHGGTEQPSTVGLGLGLGDWVTTGSSPDFPVPGTPG